MSSALEIARWAAQRPMISLLSGATLFCLGRRGPARRTQRLWALCGLFYLAAAAQGAWPNASSLNDLRAASSQESRPDLETALGFSFLAAAYAAQRLSRRETTPELSLKRDARS